MRPISSPGSMTMASPASSSPRMVQLHCSGPTGKVSRIIDPILLGSRNVGSTLASSLTHSFRFNWRQLVESVGARGLAECYCVEFAVPEHFQMDVFHLRRHQIDGYRDRLFAILVKAAGKGNVLVGALDVLFGFVLDHQMTARLGNANHLLDGLYAVGEEVEGAGCVNNVKAGIGEIGR